MVVISLIKLCFLRNRLVEAEVVGMNRHHDARRHNPVTLVVSVKGVRKAVITALVLVALPEVVVGAMVVHRLHLRTVMFM